MQISFAASSLETGGTMVVAASERDFLSKATALDKRLSGALRRAANASSVVPIRAEARGPRPEVPSESPSEAPSESRGSRPEAP